MKPSHSGSRSGDFSDKLADKAEAMKQERTIKRNILTVDYEK
jgi:hypothetical protein